jgi:prevent-host-death family protein
MDKVVTASDANRKFSELLRTVRAGQSYVVTAHGRPIAKLVPFGEHEERRSAAKAALVKRLRKQRTVNIGRWSRNDLYEDSR